MADKLRDYLTHHRWAHQAAQRAAILDSIERLARYCNPPRRTRWITGFETGSLVDGKLTPYKLPH